MTLISRGAIAALTLCLAAFQHAYSFGQQADPFDDGDQAVEIPAAEKKIRAKDAAPDRPSKIDKALDEKTIMEFIETPLADVATYLSDIHNIRVELDESRLEDAGIDKDHPITFSIRGISLDSAMRLMLWDAGCDVIARDGALVITSNWAVDEFPVTQVYSLRQLLADKPPADRELATHDLIDVIMYTVVAESWDEVGGMGSVRAVRNTLVISGSHRVQSEVATLLATLEQAQDVIAKSRLKPPTVTKLPRPSPWRKRIEKALDEEVEFEFAETPLNDVIDFLSDKAKIPMLIDERSLEDVGLAADTPVSRRIKHVTLRSALRMLLRELDLEFTIRDEVLLITSYEQAESELSARVYPVPDLVMSANDEADWLADDSWHANADYDALIEVVTASIRPNSWEDVGGYGVIESWDGCLVISQTQEVFEEIDLLFDGMRELKAQALGKPNVILTEPFALDEIDSPRTVTLRKKLAGDVGMLSFKEARLIDVLQLLSDKHDVPIVLDYRALEDIGLRETTIVSVDFGGETLADALARLGRQLDLQWLIRDEAIVVTTPDSGCCWPVTRIYPVADLVLSDETTEFTGIAPTGGSAADFDSLIDAIQSSVRPDSWDYVGGPGSAMPYHNGLWLVVSQTEDVHDELEALLAKIREVQADDREAEKQDTVDEDDSADAMQLKVYRLSSSERDDAQELAEVIRELVEPESWKANKECYLKGIGGAVIVRHKAAAHHKIRTLLETLDVMQWPQFEEEDAGGGMDFVPGVNGANTGGVFDVPDDIRGQFGGGGFGGGGFGGGSFSFGNVEPSRPKRVSAVTIPELSLPATDEQPRLPLRIYDVSEGDAKEIDNVIRELVNPKQWEQPGRYLNTVEGKLLVRADEAMHRKVRQLLEALGLVSSSHRRAKQQVITPRIPVVG